MLTLRLDELDRRILRAVRFNGRLSNAEVARQVDVSEGTVRRRIASLQDAHLLRFVAISDPRVLGSYLDAQIGIKADGDAVLQLARELAGHPELSFVATTMGSYDIWLGAPFSSADAWLEFRTELGSMPGIRETETFVNARNLKQNFDHWDVSDERHMGGGAAHDPQGTLTGDSHHSDFPPLDDLSRRILEAFRFDGRLRNADVARRVGVSEGTVRRRIAALRDARLLKFVAIIDPRTLGYLHALVGINADGDRAVEIAEGLTKSPEVPYVALAMGSFDIWVAVILPSTDAWNDFRSRLGALPGVRHTEPFLITRILKQNFSYWDMADDTLTETETTA